MSRRRQKKSGNHELGRAIRLEQKSYLTDENVDLKQLGKASKSDDFEVDFKLLDSTDSNRFETPIDFSLSKQLVPSQDITRTRNLSDYRQLISMGDHKSLNKDELRAKRIVYPEMDDYSVMNSFREIRTRLLQKSDGKNFSIMVVSLANGMGATFTSVNLGAAFAYEGGKTSLLLDCNQREHKLSKLLDLKEALGLSDYLVNTDIDIANIIHPVGINRMRLIPFGSSIDSRLEILSPERMQEFINSVKNRYVDRYLIINAPPLEVSADAAILSEVTDYVLVVVPYGKVSNNRLGKAIKSIPTGKIAGVVLNNCKHYV